MAKPIRSLILFCGGLGLALALWANDPGEPEPLSLAVWSPSRVEGVALRLPGDQAPVPLVFHPSARSPRYDYREAGPVCFVEQATGAVVAEAVVPVGWRRVLLIFAPLPAGADRARRYRVYVLDDSAGGQPPGTLVVLNQSGEPQRGLVAGQVYDFTLGLSVPLTVPPQVTVTLQVRSRGRWWQSYAGGVALTAGQRALLVLLPPYYAGSREVQARWLTDGPE